MSERDEKTGSLSAFRIASVAKGFFGAPIRQDFVTLLRIVPPALLVLLDEANCVDPAQGVDEILNTRLRRIEVAQLKWADIDLGVLKKDPRKGDYVVMFGGAGKSSRTQRSLAPVRAARDRSARRA